MRKPQLNQSYPLLTVLHCAQFVVQYIGLESPRHNAPCPLFDGGDSFFD
jgi:hypothetical protein